MGRKNKVKKSEKKRKKQKPPKIPKAARPLPPVHNSFLSTPLWRAFLDETKDQVMALPWTISEKSQNCCAVIVEPRNSADMEYIVRNVNHFTGGWKVIWFHGLGNVAQAQALAQKLPGLQLIQLPVYDLKRGYNELLTSASFYNQIPAENILVFQTDVLLLRKGIEEFLKYDYVGAPWHFGGFGNGGLSFRKKSRMLAVLQAYKFYGFQGNEDVFFVDCLQKMRGSVLPSIPKAGEFSVETVYFANPFGLHNAWNYLSPTQITTLLRRDIY